MANPKHLEVLLNGVNAWNQWRQEHPTEKPDFSLVRGRGIDLSEVARTGARLADVVDRGTLQLSVDLSGLDLAGADLSDANLSHLNLSDMNLQYANLKGADLFQTNLQRTNLQSANLSSASLGKADLYEANLVGANLSNSDIRLALLLKTNLRYCNLKNAQLVGSHFIGASLSHCDLRGADLTGASLIDSDFSFADLSGCTVFGVSAWNLKLEAAIQDNLLISNDNEPSIVADSLEMAQIIHLLVGNEKLRDMVDVISNKAILILGSFANETKPVLIAIKDELRKHGYVPILFDFNKPANRDLTETIVVLAHLARFVIADLTNPRSIPQELTSFIPNLPSVAVQPIILKRERPYAMFWDHYSRYPWVLPIHEYETQDQLISELADKIIQPAEQKAKEQRSRI